LIDLDHQLSEKVATETTNLHVLWVKPDF